jgi:hypothetical protein
VIDVVREGEREKKLEKQREEPKNSHPTYMGHIPHGFGEDQMQGHATLVELTMFWGAWGGLVLLLTLLVLFSLQIFFSELSLFRRPGLRGTTRYSI